MPMLTFNNNEHYTTAIEVDPTMRQFDDLARCLELDHFKLTVSSWTYNETPIIAIGVDRFSVEFGEYVGYVFVQMERRECDPNPLSSELLRMYAESQLWTMSKYCPTVAYSFVPYICSRKRMCARLKRFALADLHLDQCMAGIEVAMKVLGFPEQLLNTFA